MDDDLKRYLDAIEERDAAEHAETRRHFDLSMETIRAEIQLLANLIAQLSEKVDAININATVERTTAETQALIIRCTKLATAGRLETG